MDINSIKYFVTVAENKSFTVAARKLYVSQPTISKKIAELEHELGLSLFYRTGKTIRLTTAGDQLLDAFHTMLGFFDEILLLANDISNSVTGTITLGIPQYIDLSRSIPGFFSTFYRENPGFSVKLKYEPRTALINNFLEGKTDGSIFLSFDAEWLRDETPINVIPLPKGPHRLLYSPLLLPDNAHPTLSDFESHVLITQKSTDYNYDVLLKVNELIKAVGFAPANRMIAESIDALLFYITEGIGFAIMGPSFRFDKSDKIYELPVYHEKSMANLCLCWKENTDNPAFLKLISKLEQWCKDRKIEICSLT